MHDPAGQKREGPGKDQGLRARGLQERVNLVVVSDHGMAEVPPGQAIAVEDMVTMEEARVTSTGQVIGVAKDQTALAALQARHAALKARVQAWGDCNDGLQIWARQGIADPERLALLETDAFLAATAHRSLP